jgi:toxin ParE1/3/4
MSVHITRRAYKDLNEIWDYIANDSVESANRVVDRIYEALATIETNPRAGHTRDDVGDSALRFWSVYSYLVVYRLHGRKVSVTRVVHGARNLKKLFPRKK